MVAGAVGWVEVDQRAERAEMEVEEWVVSEVAVEDAQAVAHLVVDDPEEELTVESWATAAQQAVEAEVVRVEARLGAAISVAWVEEEQQPDFARRTAARPIGGR